MDTVRIHDYATTNFLNANPFLDSKLIHLIPQINNISYMILKFLSRLLGDHMKETCDSKTNTSRTILSEMTAGIEVYQMKARLSNEARKVNIHLVSCTREHLGNL